MPDFIIARTIRGKGLILPDITAWPLPSAGILLTALPTASAQPASFTPARQPAG